LGNVSFKPYPSRELFGSIRPFGGPSAREFLVWDHWETALLAQILAGSLLEANFRHLRALGPAITIPFWDHWETAPFGPNPGREPFGSKFLPLQGPSAGY